MTTDICEMVKPLPFGRIHKLLIEAKDNGLNEYQTAHLLAEASVEGGPGPKPDDYLTIHADGTSVSVAVSTHYINHDGLWTAGGPVAHIRKILPPKGYSQLVNIEFSDLHLARTNDDQV